MTAISQISMKTSGRAAGHRCRQAWAALALCLVQLCAAAESGEVPLDHTTPRAVANQETRDPKEKLEALRQELFRQQQETTYATFLLENRDRIRARRMLFPSGKELIPGYIFSPVKLQKGQRCPGLVLVHGAWHGRLQWHFFDVIDHAVARGYVVMFPEYRGSAGYGEEHYKNDYGITDVEDVLASADYLVKSTPHVDAERLAIYGHSRGGMITLLAIERAPSRFRAAVHVAGLADFIAFMAYKPDFRRAEIASEKFFGGKLPAEDLAPYLEISPLSHVDKIRTPLFVAATTGDDVVPVTLHAGRLIEALRARGKAYESRIYESAPGRHLFLFGDTDERRDLFERTFAFLDKHLQP